MYNFNFAVPSALILCIILFFFISSPRLPIRQNRLFFGIIALEILVLLFDLLSSQADMAYESTPIPLTIILNMMFFILFIARIYWFFLYSVDLLGLLALKNRLRHILFSLVCIICEIITVSSFVTGAVFTVDASGYHKGPLYSVIYVCFFFYLALSLVLTIIYRRRLSKRQFIWSLTYTLILVAGNIVRILLPNYLVMNTFCLMAIIVIFLAFENPAFYTSNAGGFSRNSLRKYMAEQISDGNYRLLGISILNYSDAHAIYGINQMERGISLICSYFKKKYPKTVLFYLHSGCFVLAGPASMDCETMIKELTERFRNPWLADDTDLYLNVSFAHLSSASGLTSADRIVESLLLAMSEFNQLPERTDSPESAFLDVDHADNLEWNLKVKRILDHAIEENCVEVFFQPIIDAKSGELAGIEALARLRDEDGKVISPNEFIPLAEKNGQINRLGNQVAEYSCRFLRDHSASIPWLKWVNINLSPVQCMDRDLCTRLMSLLEKYEIPASKIHLEITEDSMIDFSVLLEQMKKLKDQGFFFAVDDYGSGYSNMNRLRYFPFTNIKLDMAVVQSHCRQPDKMLPTFVEIFKEMGYSITAEGIETKEMADIMRSMGCDYLQGYYYSRPLPVNEFLNAYGL